MALDSVERVRNFIVKSGESRPITLSPPPIQEPMRKCSNIQRHAGISLVLLVMLCWMSMSGAAQLIGNASLPFGSVTRNEARLLFLMRRPQWPDGQAVHVFVLAEDHPQHQSFCKENLQIYPRKLRQAWERRLYSGTGQASLTVESEKEMLQRVSTTPGAIGYLPANKTNNNVKILQIR